MKNSLRRVVGLVLATVFTFSTVSLISINGAELNNYGGWLESMYASWEDSSAKDATVEYKRTSDGSYQVADNELIRQYGSNARVDIVGLPAGSYDMKITTSKGEVITKNNIEVMAHDRSGYAHYNYSEGVGAYNNDGSLKDNAIVLYVTEENKNDVTVTSKDGTTVSGIGNILNSRGAVPNKNKKGVVVSTVINTNQGIIKKLAEDGTPLDIRIIGKVTPPEGLTAYDSYDYGGTEGDNGFMARMQSGKDVTIEGIGYDAEMFGWGIHFMAQSSNPELGKSFEARNLEFDSYPEDALGFEGIQSGSELTTPVERVWVHNNSFMPGYCANPAESDKKEGDGSCDFKRGRYYTMDYNYYTNCHKTNLIGSSDTSLQYNMTLHHNQYVSCMARGPLARQGNIHMYNNYYQGQTSYAVNPRANAYIFSEYNNYVESKNPMVEKSGGVVKSFNDVFLSCSGEKNATIVKSRDEEVKNNNLYGDFERNSSLSYIPSGNYLLDTDTNVAKAKVLAYAGHMKDTVLAPEEINTSLVDSSLIPSEAVAIPSSFVFDKTTVPSTSPVNLGGLVVKASKANTPITIKDQGVVFKLDKAAVVTMNGVDGSVVPELYDEGGKCYISAKGQALLQPGVYFIQSSVYDVKSGYKESKIESIKFESEDTPIVTEATTEATTVGFVPMKRMELKKGNGFDKDLTCVVDNIEYDIAGIASSCIKIKNESTIDFKVNKACKFTFKAAKYGLEISSVNGGQINYNGKKAGNIAISKDETGKGAEFTVELTPGAYTIIGDSSSNTELYYFEFSALAESDTYYGDADGDGYITATDAAIVALNSGNGKFPVEDVISGIDVTKYIDLNSDGKYDELDGKEIMKKALDGDYNLIK